MGIIGLLMGLWRSISMMSPYGVHSGSATSLKFLTDFFYLFPDPAVRPPLANNDLVFGDNPSAFPHTWHRLLALPLFSALFLEILFNIPGLEPVCGKFRQRGAFWGCFWKIFLLLSENRLKTARGSSQIGLRTENSGKRFKNRRRENA
jgi:hypothetical protein